MAMILELVSMPTDVSARGWLFGRKKDEKRRREREERQQEKTSFTPTYLDTLNRGREVALAKDEFPSEAAPVQTGEGHSPAAEQQVPAYQVQCLASSQIDMVRAEKKTLDSRAGYPVQITFDHPFYKLLVGSFAQRKQAEKALVELKRLGYEDAWIVKNK